MTDHDAGYRALFSDKTVVADLIRGFVKEPWVENLDLDTLQRVSGSFVTEKFKKRENDVVWRVRFRDQWLYVYLLIEFQSTVDRFMALRLLVYVGLLYQRLVDEKQVAGGAHLPPVLPIVLYNGRQRWTAPLDVAELVWAGPDEQLDRYRPRMQYLLLDETAHDEAELAGMQNLLAIVFRREKCDTPAQFARVLDDLVGWAADHEHRPTVDRIKQWLRVILWPHRVPDDEIEQFTDIGEYIGMLKEQIRQWEQKAHEEGIEKGIEQGIEQGEAEVLLRQLKQKFGAVSGEILRRVDQAESEQLLTWAERILTAERIEDVFA